MSRTELKNGGEEKWVEQAGKLLSPGVSSVRGSSWLLLSTSPPPSGECGSSQLWRRTNYEGVQTCSQFVVANRRDSVIPVVCREGEDLLLSGLRARGGDGG